MADVTIKITLPQAKAIHILDTIATTYNYQELLPDGSPNPETKKQFVYRKILSIVRDAFRAGKVKENDTTVQQIKEDADTYTADIVIE